MYASYEGHAEVVKLLLEAGADIQTKNKVSCSLIFRSVEYHKFLNTQILNLTLASYGIR